MNFNAAISKNGQAVAMVRVTADNKTDAAAFAVAKVVANAKTYNAKYAPQFAANGLNFIAQDEDAAAYTVRSVRKLAA